MTIDPFADLAAALNAPTDASPYARLRLDPDRAARTGIPEFVLAERKSVEDVVASLTRLAERGGRSLASRVRPDQFAALSAAIAAPFVLDAHPEARVAIVVHEAAPRPSTGGRIAVIAAGTSDRPIATEAAIVAEEMGCEVRRIHDVGVAGLHRLVAPLRAVMADGVDAIIVAAGMDGALPSVIAGLVPVPVIGLPVSVGYGYGGDGTGALMSMLQACAPGIAVVNIDNGVGAGSMAALIANRAAAGRSFLPADAALEAGGVGLGDGTPDSNEDQAIRP
ncbi:MAG: nickel pincer cofactor biosynthesis protein LarB [Thermomicrobiales bacterium]